jgi:hypothetical protein
MTRSSTASDLARLAPVALLALLVGPAGCASTGGLGPDDPERVRRRPDGVAIDPVSAPPPPRDHAEAADGLVTLRTPLGVDRAIATVADFFHKIVLADGEGLDALFTRDALAVTSLAPGGGGGQTPPAIQLWQARFRKLDYRRLAGELVYREPELDIYRADDAREALFPAAIRPDQLGDNDVVVRVPILLPHVGADRLFGDEMILWLRRDGDRYRIYRILEDFQLN